MMRARLDKQLRDYTRSFFKVEIAGRNSFNLHLSRTRANRYDD